MFRFAIVLVFVFAAVSAFGQIVISASDAPPLGSTWTTYAVNGVPFTFNQNGANRTWTLPSDTYESTSFTWIAPSSTPFSADFPTATLCEYLAVPGSPGDGEYIFLRVANNGVYVQGQAVVVSGTPLVYAFDTEYLQMPFPLTMGTNWTFSARFTMAPGFVMVDSGIVSVDGWGSLVSPYGTWPALRAIVHRYHEDPGQPMTDDGYRYTWAIQNVRGGAEVSSSDGSLEPNFTTADLRICVLTPTAAEPDRGPLADRFSLGQNYPNPFNPTTVLPVELERAGEMTLTIYDETGRVVSTQHAVLSAGTHNLAIDGSQWASGTYFAQVRQGGEALVRAMQLVK